MNRSTGRVSAKRAPGIRQRLPLPYGYVTEVRNDPLRFYSRLVREYGPVVRWDIGSMVVHLVVDPEQIHQVLIERWKNYPRSKFTRMVSIVVGEGLVVTEGDVWRQQRRLIQPAFHRSALDSFLDVMTSTTESMLDAWAAHADSQRPIDVSQEMANVALRIVGQALFSKDLAAEAAQMGDRVRVAMEYLNYRFNHMFAPPLWVPTLRNLRFKKAQAASHKMIDGMIKERKASPMRQHDLLEMLIQARDEETGESMSDKQVRDETLTFIGAGHETTAMALAWTWYLLSTHPEVQQRVRAEIDTVLGGRTPELADLPKLELTRRVIEESLRLYPPVWALSKEAVNDDELGGFHIPSKSLVVLLQYVTQRLPEYWPNPEGFDPDRFLPEEVEKRPRTAYFPFGAGPHICIGLEFAMREAIVVLAMTMQRYRLDLVPGHPVVMDPIFTLRQRDGVLMHVRRV